MDDAAAKLRDIVAPVRVEPIALPPLQTLRLFDTGEADIASASTRLGFDLPLAAGRFGGGSPAAVRLGPGEWLVRDGSAEKIAERLAGVLHHVTEVGPGRCAWRIGGPSARDLIAAGCSVDLHPSVFPPGAGVRTLLAQVGVILCRPHHGDGFELIAARPVEAYLAAWLDDAALGFLP